MERARLSSKMSSLTVGKGKIARYNDVEKMELHLDPRDYTNLVTQRIKPKSMFSLIQIDPDDSTNVDESLRDLHNKDTENVSHKHVQTTLPKTYITKSGSLFLYTDSKIIKDNQEKFPRFDSDSAKEIQIHGRKVATHRITYPSWGKLLSPQRSSPVTPRSQTGKPSKRETHHYIRGFHRPSMRIPYTSNYAITPVKLINTDSTTDIDTVRSLSEAVLAYRERIPTEQDKYMTTMKHTWRGKSDREYIHEHRDVAGNQQDVLNGNKGRLSKWTREWIESQTTMAEEEPNVQSARTDKQTPNMLSLERARTTLNLTCRGLLARVPTNTPMSDTRWQGKLNLKSRSRVSSETPLHMVHSPSVRSKSASPDQKFL